MSENAAHKHVFKLLAPVQWEEAASRGTAEERQRCGLFLSATTETLLLIYGVSMSWAGRVLPERLATGGRGGEGKESKSEKGLRLKEKGGGSHNPTQQ